MTVGERIASRRKELNMTQEELAKKLGYKSRSSINKIELSWSKLPLSKLEKIAAALDCDAAYLMGWEDSPSGSDTRERILKAFDQMDPELQELFAAQAEAALAARQSPGTH